MVFQSEIAMQILKDKNPTSWQGFDVKRCDEVTTLSTIMGKIRNEKLFMQLSQLCFGASSRPFQAVHLT